MRLNGQVLHTQTLDFKKGYEEGDTVEFKYENPLPGYIPGGNYNLQLQYKNGNNNNGCMAFSFKI